MTSINKKYFKNAELYGKAMELLAQWEEVKEGDFDAADNFLANLENDEVSLLKRAEKQIAEDKGFNYQESQFKQLKTAFVDVKNDPFLKELIELWLSEKRKKLKPSSFESDKSKMDMFYTILSELGHSSISIADLNVGILRTYIDTIQNLPAVRNSSSLLNKKFSELAKLDIEKISSKTFKYNLRTVSGFLNWVSYKGYDIDPKLKVILEGSLKDTLKEDRSKRVPFDNDDLKALFLSDDYIKGTFKRPSDYWVPLIALFTGARLGEIAQLTLDDIKKVEDCWVFDINEEGEGKSIKNKSGSRRVIPIHKQLINLNFIEFVEHIKQLKETKLFFDEQRSAEGKFAQLQKRMSYYIKHVAKIESSREKTKVFHSFRHLVRTKFVDAGVDERVIDSIVGHTSKERSIGNSHYTHSDFIKQKVDAMRKIKYDLEFSSIKNWNYCRFIKTDNS
jgi:integrase